MKKEHSGKYKAVLEKGQANLDKYNKITVMTQNVFRLNKRHVKENTQYLSAQKISKVELSLTVLIQFCCIIVFIFFFRLSVTITFLLTYSQPVSG